MSDSQEPTNPGKLIDQKLIGFFFDRDSDTHIRKLIFAFEENDFEIVYDEPNHTFKFTVIDN